MSIQHILAPFHSDNESAWIAIDLADQILQQDMVPALWGTETQHQNFIPYGVNLIRPYQGKVPTSGKLIVVGTEINIGNWYESMHFNSTALLIHQFSPNGFSKTMHRLTLQGNRQVSVQYTNLQLSRKIGLPGDIVELPFNPQRTFKSGIARKSEGGKFTLGRIGADELNKHHFNDIEFYKKLADSGLKVKIMGGTCLKPWLDGIENIELSPSLENSKIGDTLHLLDCIYQNVPPSVFEGPSIAIMAAMHLGLPIIASAGGGCAQQIKAYKQGIIIDNHQEAFKAAIKISGLY